MFGSNTHWYLAITCHYQKIKTSSDSTSGLNQPIRQHYAKLWCIYIHAQHSLHPCPDCCIGYIFIIRCGFLSALRRQSYSVMVLRSPLNKYKPQVKCVMLFLSREPSNLTAHSTLPVTTMTWRLTAQSIMYVTSRKGGQTRAGESEQLNMSYGSSFNMQLCVADGHQNVLWSFFDPFKQCIWIAHWHSAVGSVQFTHKDQLYWHYHHWHALWEEVL